MDAVKCIKEFNRMCRSYDCCSDGCPLKRRCILFRNPNTDSETIEELVAAVEKWSKEHPLPLKTNGMVIMETLARMDVPCVGTAMNELKQKMEIEIDAEKTLIPAKTLLSAQRETSGK